MLSDNGGVLKYCARLTRNRISTTEKFARRTGKVRVPVILVKQPASAAVFETEAQRVGKRVGEDIAALVAQTGSDRLTRIS